MSTLSESQKLDMSIKESTANQKVISFLILLLKLAYNTIVIRKGKKVWKHGPYLAEF